jgi:predicted class III extradiol MEMO1 family dioxygenase
MSGYSASRVKSSIWVTPLGRLVGDAEVAAEVVAGEVGWGADFDEGFWS